MVGFNRRFSPYVREAKKFVERRSGPLMAVYRINSGRLPPNDWQLDVEQGGTRIIGECGHFLDTLCYLTGCVPAEVFASAISGEGKRSDASENAALTVRFTDGSVGVIVYTTQGSPAFSKERLEVFVDGSVAVIDDFRHIELIRNEKRKKRKDWLKQDKGHTAEIKAFIQAVRAGSSPVTSHDYFQTTLCTLLAVESMASGQPQGVSLQILEESLVELSECCK
jgi:predicted dehydrogenase